MTVLMVATIGTINITAEETPETFSATYTFVEENGETLPDDLVDDLLPFDINDATKGEKLSVSDYDPYTSSNGFTYDFKGWNTYSVTVETDVEFIGTWAKRAATPTPTTPTTPSSKVGYEFVLDTTLETFHDLDDLLPTEEMNEEDLPDYGNLGLLSFVRWDRSEILYDDGTTQVFYVGVWHSNASLFHINETYPASPPAGYPVSTDGEGSAGIPHNNVPRMRISGQPAYCIEPQVSGFPLSGTVYYEKGSLDSTIANIIFTGEDQHASTAQIQAAIWCYKGGSAYCHCAEVGLSGHWQSMYDDSYDCWGTVYHTYKDPDGSLIQELGVADGRKKKDGKVTINKRCSTTVNYAATCPGTYTLAGAVYGLYNDAECTDLWRTLTTNASGNTETLIFTSPRQFWVKEISPSEGFKLDTRTYYVYVDVGITVNITSQEDPYDDPVIITLVKNPSNPLAYIDYLDTAEFTVRYYDKYVGENEMPTGTPRYTWTFKPIVSETTGLPTVILDKTHLVSGDTTMFDVQGDLKIPLGSFTIEETKAPQTFLRDPEIYLGHTTLVDGKVEATVEGKASLTVVHDTQTEQLEKVGILNTTCWFENYETYLGSGEANKHVYTADGMTTVIDTVSYENLDPESWFCLKGKLVEKIIDRDVKCWTEADVTAGDCTAEDVGKPILWTEQDFTDGLCTEEEVGKERYVTVTVTEGGLIAEGETIFKTPEADAEGMVSGKVDVKFTINAEDYPDKDFVAYEYLHEFTPDAVTPGPGTGTGDDGTGTGTGTGDDTDPTDEIPTGTIGAQLTYHEDIYDEGQCVHIDPLYTASVQIWKTNGSPTFKLSGAVFEVSATRTKRDGTVVDTPLGKMVSGGIIYESDNAFTLEIYEDEACTVSILSVEAKVDEKLGGKYIAMTTELEDGEYYCKTTEDATVKHHFVAKGGIYLEPLPEDTKVSFHELKAPAGYYVLTHDYIVDIGHDYTSKKLENFCSNQLIVYRRILDTGIEE